MKNDKFYQIEYYKFYDLELREAFSKRFTLLIRTQF